MKALLLIAAFAFCICTTGAQGQTNWTHFKYNDLPVNGISFVIQSDYQGGVYLGLTGGLAKFDGVQWNRFYYNVADPNLHSNEYNVRTLVVLPGRIWAGTNQGLIKFENGTKRYYDLNSNPEMCDDKTRGIATDSKGNVWFVNWCVAMMKLDVSADTVAYYPLSTTIHMPMFSDATMYCDSKDNLWIENGGGGDLIKYANGAARILDAADIPPLAQDTVTSLVVRPDDGVVVTMCRHVGILRDDNGVTSYEPIPVPAGLMDDNEYFAIVKLDLEGNIWILGRDHMGDGTFSRNFYRYDKNKTWTRYPFPVFPGTSQNGENLYALTDLTIDEVGRVWFSDPYYGVFRYDSKVTAVEATPVNPLPGIYPNPASTLLTLTNGETARSVDIYSILGVNVLRADDPTRIDVSRLAPGQYFLRSSDRHSRVTVQPFSIQR